MLSTLAARLTHFILTTPYEVGTVIFPILEMRKQRYREGNQLAQGHAFSQ